MYFCREGRSGQISSNAAGVTGQYLAHRLPVRAAASLHKRSAVVTRPHSGPKYECGGRIFEMRPNAGNITTSLLNKNCRFSHDTVVPLVYTGCTFWFYPRPLRQSGKQGTARIVKPVHRRKPRSIFKPGQRHKVCPFSTSGTASKPVPLCRHPPVFNHEPCV